MLNISQENHLHVQSECTPCLNPQPPCTNEVRDSLSKVTLNNIGTVLMLPDYKRDKIVSSIPTQGNEICRIKMVNIRFLFFKHLAVLPYNSQCLLNELTVN